VYWGTGVVQRHNVYRSSRGVQVYCRRPGVVHWYRFTAVLQVQRCTGVVQCYMGYMRCIGLQIVPDKYMCTEVQE